MAEPKYQEQPALLFKRYERNGFIRVLIKDLSVRMRIGRNIENYSMKKYEEVWVELNRRGVIIKP